MSRLNENRVPGYREQSGDHRQRGWGGGLGGKMDRVKRSKLGVTKSHRDLEHSIKKKIDKYFILFFFISPP